MIRDYSKNYSDLTKAMQKLGGRIPETMKGFSELHTARHKIFQFYLGKHELVASIYRTHRFPCLFNAIYQE